MSTMITLEVPQEILDNAVVTVGASYGYPDAREVNLFWQKQNWPVVTVSETALSVFKTSMQLDAGEIEILALA